MSEPIAGAPLWLLPPPVLLPQRNDQKARWLDRVETIVTGIPALILPWLLRARLSRIITMANAHDAAFRVATDAMLEDEARELRQLLRLRGLRIELVARTFALIREAAGRTVG